MFNYRLLKVIKLSSLGLTNERDLDIDVVSCKDKIIEKRNENDSGVEKAEENL